MIDGIYIAASGGYKQEKRLEVISNNLANLNTVGFKRDVLAFKSFLAPFPGSTKKVSLSSVSGLPILKEDASHTGIVELISDLSQGDIISTGNPLDVALDGEGFFPVQTKDGIRYTRRGNFRLNKNNVLVTHKGDPVVGQGGQITIPPGSPTVTIDAKGKISVGKGKGNRSVGQLKIVNFDDPKKLIKTGNDLFILKDTDIKEISVKKFSLKQGFLESSNVKPMKEMTKMIEVLRTYQAYQQVIQTFDSVNARAVNDIGRLA